MLIWEQMIQLSSFVIFELVIGLFLWWTAIYLITQNPTNKIAQLSALLMTALSFYFSSDVFFAAIEITKQYYLDPVILRSFSWAMYLPPLLICHTSFLLLKGKSSLWRKLALPFAYLLTFALIIIEITTNFIRNYSFFYSSNFHGNLSEATGHYFYLIGILFISIMIITAYNFYQTMKLEQKLSNNWYKYFWPFIGNLLAILLGPVVLLSYYGYIPHPIFLPATDFLLMVLPLTYSIIRYNLFIDEAKIIFGRKFYYSTLAVAVLIGIYSAIIGLTVKFDSIHSIILPFILIYLLIASHPLYEWVVTLLRDIIYRVPSGHSLITDDEVANAIREYNNPEKLEENTISKLDIVEARIKRGEIKTQVDGVRAVVKDAIEYFKPDHEIDRRIKKNLKYQILKMIAFDESEEGQILWELGFDEYPVKIMSNNRGQKPKFEVVSPADYTYTSRNAYLALKKEAIHDVTWRISYLEKLAKK